MIAGLTACAVGPTYRAPRPDVPAKFAATADAMQSASAATSATPNVDLATWWRALDDEELNSLVERAVKSNLDLAIALTRLQQARTYEAVVIGHALPQVDTSAAAARGTGSDLTRGRAAQPIRSADDAGGLQQITRIAGFDAVWEIDIFGKYRREIQAARFDTQAAAEARYSVITLLIADVVRAYVEILDPVAGAILLAGDFRDPAIAGHIREGLGGPADLVLSDMAAPATGHAATDHLRIVALAEDAFAFAETILKPGGAFVAKVFQGGTEGALLAALKRAFAEVRHAKPAASRTELARDLCRRTRVPRGRIGAAITGLHAGTGPPARPALHKRPPNDPPSAGAMEIRQALTFDDVMLVPAASVSCRARPTPGRASPARSSSASRSFPRRWTR